MEGRAPLPSGEAKILTGEGLWTATSDEPSAPPLPSPRHLGRGHPLSRPLQHAHSGPRVWRPSSALSPLGHWVPARPKSGSSSCPAGPRGRIGQEGADRRQCSECLFTPFPDEPQPESKCRDFAFSGGILPARKEDHSPPHLLLFSCEYPLFASPLLSPVNGLGQLCMNS